MRLFLASEGSDPRTIDKLKKYIGDFDGKSVIYIPTARNGENAYGDWNDSDTWKFLTNSGMKVESFQIEDYKRIEKTKLIKVFENKDIVWMSGGAAGYLMYWIRRVGLDKILPRTIHKSLYVGSSAGSMITAPTLNVADWYIGEEEVGASFIPGLGLVNFDIYPHYKEGQYEQIKEKYTGNKLYLVKNGDVVLVENGKAKVLGEEKIITNG